MIALAIRTEAQPEPLDPRDVYTPDVIYMLLRNYWELDRGALGPAEGSYTPRRNTKRSIPYTNFVQFAIRRAEIDAALRWLTGVDPDAADAISDYYIMGRPIDQVATRADRSERTVYRQINSGVHQMARRLGWRPAKERLHPYVDEEGAAE